MFFFSSYKFSISTALFWVAAATTTVTAGDPERGDLSTVYCLPNLAVEANLKKEGCPPDENPSSCNTTLDSCCPINENLLHDQYGGLCQYGSSTPPPGDMNATDELTDQDSSSSSTSFVTGLGGATMVTAATTATAIIT